MKKENSSASNVLETFPSVYTMGLHQFKHITDGFTVLRVPGGWIYTQYRLDSNIMTSIFVPFNNEFQKELPND
jgi:hypothetical protein